MIMKRTLLSALAIFVAMTGIGLSSHAAEPVRELTILTPFADKTWQSVSGSVDGSDGFTDVARWEWILNGQALRITHSVNEGAYAGESLIHWDGQQGKIIYRYVTTAGFYTDGVITPADGGGIDVHEYVRGAMSGPTETRAHYKVSKDGRIHAWSQFLTDGVWTKKQIVTYEEAPDARVVLP